MEYRARNVIAAILKRLTHRTSNVQLYTLTLAESLTKNCGIEVHREIASRAFTQGLERLVLDRVRSLWRFPVVYQGLYLDDDFDILSRIRMIKSDGGS